MNSTVTGAGKDEIRSAALGLGFAACGFTDARPLDRGPLLGRWLAEGRHGDMSYLERDPASRIDVRRVLDCAASVIVCAWPYPAPPPQPNWRDELRGRIAAYAAGTDYHRALAAKLESLGRTVTRLCGGRSLVHVDAGSLLEKDLAVRAGIGWYGHNTLVLAPAAGSYLLLGCLLTEARFAPDSAVAAGGCGSCRACKAACPTGAIADGPTIDARLCISYLTIEHRGPIARDLRARIGNWVFGCDTCQQTCPENRADSGSHEFLNPSLPELLRIGEEEFRARYANSAVSRVKRRGMARNAAVALGNSGNAEAVAALVRALESHDETLVRVHAAWALGRIGNAEARRALAAAERRSEPPPLREEIAAALQA